MMPSSSPSTISSMNPALYYYASHGRGNLELELQSLLESELTPQKNTALHIAAKFGQIESVKEIHNHCPTLLRRTNSKGDTALHLAARNGFPEIVQFLIDQDKQQQKLIHHDIELGIGQRNTDQEVAESLIRMTNNKKDTALHEVVRNHFLFDGKKETDYFELVKLLTEGDREFQYLANDAGETPLYIAAEEGLHEFVFQLLEACSSSSHYRGPFGRTPLHAAVYGLHLGMTKTLLEKKPKLIREVDDDGWSPLHFAVSCRSLEMVKLLLMIDRSVAYLPNKEGISPIHMASPTPVDPNPLIFRELMLYCPDSLELVDKNGRNPLHFLAINSYGYLLPTILLKDGFQCLANEVDNEGNAFLHLAAARHNYITAYATLNDHFADTLAMNNHYLTPLDIARTEKVSKFAAGWSSCVKKWKKMSAVRRRVRQVCHNKVESKGKIEEKNKFESNKGNSDINLLVATLIATVTFAAGFTTPGGFNGNSPDAGAAILAKNTYFKAFLISNTVAMVFSITAVKLHFWATLYQGFLMVEMFPKIGVRLTVLAASSMVIAFMTGTCAVLPTSHGLAIAVCVICSSFFLFLGLCLTVPFFCLSLSVLFSRTAIVFSKTDST
ncbi:hypothetical protein NE237_030534 [Protea cynaroides]|uniref:PGG domain-containing protein n=1 Tax=Protea cynaroides TaxID=273540 RepID=A0A9Q0JW57_9MAGN|nr:hypothetical protein NE237_030534 [Protea cynaroides]